MFESHHNGSRGGEHDLLLYVWESGLQQVCRVFSQEDDIGHAGVHLRWVVKGGLDNIQFNKLEHSSKHDALEFETTLVIGIGKDKEYILDDAQEILLEEGSSHSRICRC